MGTFQLHAFSFQVSIQAPGKAGEVARNPANI